jgi:tripartite-type tricarboxylate transporter receptor subunit TctC
MSAALQAALADPALRRQLAERGTTPRGGPPEDYARLAASELERWQRVVTAGRIRAD